MSGVRMNKSYSLDEGTSRRAPSRYKHLPKLEQLFGVAEVAEDMGWSEWKALWQYRGKNQAGSKNTIHTSDDKPFEKRVENAIWREWWTRTQLEKGTIAEGDEGVEDEEEKQSSPVETAAASEACEHEDLEEMVIHASGTDRGDIPTEYSVQGMREHELPVIGTYVDFRIMPGFRYRVRLNPTDEYLFGGVALPLLGIGMGYGKRLTFQGESLNQNRNFFWSDSRQEGYAFSVESVSSGECFELTDASGEPCGSVTVTDASEPQRELDCHILDDGGVEKHVQVSVEANVSGSVTRLVGQAVVVKPQGQLLAQCVRIEGLQGEGLQGCSLRPL